MTREIVIRIQIPDGMEAPLIDYDEPPHSVYEREGFVSNVPMSAKSEQTPSGSGAQCKHGRMIHKAGTSKAGKDYDGYFCPKDECKPVWA